MKYITYIFSIIKLKFFIHIELFWITIRIFIQTHNFQFNLPFRTWICTAAVLNWLTEHEYSPLSVFFACSIYSLVTRSSFDLKNQLSCYTLNLHFNMYFPKKKKKRKICKRSMSNHDRIEYREKLKSIVERTCYEISLVRISKER